MSETIRASDFKATCLKLLDEVQESGRSYVVTKRGKPVAKLVPIEEPEPLEGSVRILADRDEELFSTGEIWDAG